MSAPVRQCAAEFVATASHINAVGDLGGRMTALAGGDNDFWQRRRVDNGFMKVLSFFRLCSFEPESLLHMPSISSDDFLVWLHQLLMSLECYTFCARLNITKQLRLGRYVVFEPTLTFLLCRKGKRAIARGNEQIVQL